MRRKKTRKTARKDNPRRKHAKRPTHHRKAKRRDNPTRKRSHAKRRARRRNPVHTTKKQVRRSPVGYSIHKKHPRRRKKARMDNPARRRSHHRRHHARRDNPVRRHKRRHYGRRRSNPTHAGMGTATAGVMDMVVVGLSVVGGMIAADFVDRFVATRAGAKGNTPHDATAAALIAAPPDTMRIAAQAGLSVLSVVGAYYLHKKGHKQAAEVLGGMGIGAGAHVAMQLWNDKAMPLIAKSDKTATTAGTNWAARLYPDLQSADLQALSDAAAKTRNDTLGPQRQVQAPRAQGPQGSPRVAAPPQPAARPAANKVDCGMDMGQAMVIQQLRQEIADMKAAMAGRNSGGAPAEAPSNNVTAIDPLARKKRSAFA